jgi:DNA repair exonuclease SbcCD ATPase subunit
MLAAAVLAGEADDEPVAPAAAGRTTRTRSHAKQQRPDVLAQVADAARGAAPQQQQQQQQEEDLRLIQLEAELQEQKKQQQKQQKQIDALQGRLAAAVAAQHADKQEMQGQVMEVQQGLQEVQGAVQQLQPRLGKIEKDQLDFFAEQRAATSQQRAATSELLRGMHALCNAQPEMRRGAAAAAVGQCAAVDINGGAEQAGSAA